MPVSACKNTGTPLLDDELDELDEDELDELDEEEDDELEDELVELEELDEDELDELEELEELDEDELDELDELDEEDDEELPFWVVLPPHAVSNALNKTPSHTPAALLPDDVVGLMEALLVGGR